jgi:2-isopropylmalate synthase
MDSYQVNRERGVDQLQAELVHDGMRHTITGSGNGVVAAFVDAVEQFTGKQIVLVEYSEHALSHSADAEAVCYIQLNVDGERVCGVGRSHDIIQASLEGILSAMNRAHMGEQHVAA